MAVPDVLNRCVMILALCALASCVSGAPVAIDAYFRPDVAFPERARFWDGNPNAALGGSIQVYIKNDGKQELKLSDALIDGVSLTKAIAFSEQRKFRKHSYAASIHFSAISERDKTKLIAAGEPVWWRFDPTSLKPGECGELIVRLRHKPAGDVRVMVAFSGAGAVDQTVRTRRIPPRMESISFSMTRDRAYLYLNHAQKGLTPSRITLDGEDITSRARIFSDPASSIAPVVCDLPAPLSRGSLHCFQAVYPNGDKISAASRVWDDEFAYGMWGAQPGKQSDTASAGAYLQALADHNINTQMEQVGSDAVRSFMLSDEGVRLMKSLGIRRMVSDPGKDKSLRPWAYFLMDEPDAGDAKVKGLPADSQVGALGQGIVERSFELRRTDPPTPQLLNLDMTYKPRNWYTYGQIPDILTADPYYQIRLAQAYRSKPETVPMFSKADFVHAVVSAIKSSQAPRPVNCVLFAGSPAEPGKPFRFASPEEKRIEVYYALAAGAKGISYWWFHSLARGLGPGKQDALAAAQWREIGLLGAEVRTVGPLITIGCPVTLPIDATDKLWTRAILCGSDTLVLLCVNDDYLNDKTGTHIKPIESAKLSVTLPAWLAATDAFEVDSAGIEDIKWRVSESKSVIDLGKVNVTRMLVVTSDAGLRTKLGKLYDAEFAANVEKLPQ